MSTNLRHLRIFLAVADSGSITQAAKVSHISQPAVTQAIQNLELRLETTLFQRTPHGLFLTHAGGALSDRVRRAFARLDPALNDVAPRLRITATSTQLHALIAMAETENFTLAARRLGLAQPTVHRAVTRLEQEASRALFERTPHGMIASRTAQALALAARLTFTELDQAEADLAGMAGRDVGQITVGSMPLSRSYILPRAIAGFRLRRPTLPIKALDGPYDNLVARLRRGEVDVLIGALREPMPIADIVQEKLFDDELVILAGLHHPLSTCRNISIAQLAAYPWVVALENTPTRQHFNKLFEPLAGLRPTSLVETGSMMLMRELLRISDHLGFISKLQIEAEIALGAVTSLPVNIEGAARPIGLTTRTGWVPTRAQQEFMDELRAAALPYPQV